MTGADNQQGRLDSYLAGYVDGAGCFSVVVQRNPRSALGLQLAPTFQVSQNDDRTQVLEKIRERMGCGYIKPNHAKRQADRTFVLVIKDRKALLQSVIPFFEANPLLSIKQKEFEQFASIVGDMEKGRHLTVAGFRELLVRAISMNGGGRYRKVDWLAAFDASIQNPQRLHARQERPALSKIQSELHGDMQSEAEMTSPPEQSL